MRLCFSQTGDPSAVLHLDPYEPPAPKGREVVVKMLYAPINPADFNFIDGTYGKQPSLPAVPGTEGCGTVEAVGPEVEALTPGDSVIPLHSIGSWSQYVLTTENHLAKLPPGLDPVQASMLRINPATAWQMLHVYRDLKPGEFVVQNAANSGVGRCVIQIAKHLGWRTLNLVRRAELHEELTTLGAEYVLLDDDNAPDLARSLAQNAPIPLALNGVGGDSALRLMDILSPGGAHITFGAMSRRSLKVPNKFLIFKGIDLHGYWVTRWMESASRHAIHEVLHPLAEMVRDGSLVQPVESIVPLTSFPDALAAAKKDRRSGKVVLKMEA